MVSRAIALSAMLVATSAIAARDPLLQGTLSIAGATGHDCLLPASQHLNVELLLDAPTGGFALLGFLAGSARHRSPAVWAPFVLYGR